MLKRAVAGLYGQHMFISLRNHPTLSRVSVPCYVPTSNVWPVRFLCPLWYLLLLLFILVTLIDVCNETSFWFLFAFSWWLMMSNIFSWACLPSASSSMKYLFMSFAHVLIILYTNEFWEFCMYPRYKSFVRYVVAWIFNITPTKEKNQYNLPGLLTWKKWLLSDVASHWLKSCPSVTPRHTRYKTTHTHTKLGGSSRLNAWAECMLWKHR